MTSPTLFLDISRLLRRLERGGGPTGIDRIELAYARHEWRAHGIDRRFVIGAGPRVLALPEDAAHGLVDSVAARWTSGATPPTRLATLAGGRLARWRLLAGARPAQANGPAVTLNVGHEGLEHPMRLARAPGAFAALVHDVIPLTHPEYDTPRMTALHRRRVDALAAHAAHVITNSDATRQELLTAAPGARFGTTVAHFGPGLEPAVQAAPFDRPTFVHLSTINRRKNLALLLHIWRELAPRPDAPRLLVIGRRGNDGTALELLDRCEALRPVVTAAGPLGDRNVAAHLAGARALLTPSFAEGFGLPIVEAHAAGVPVIASDLPAHREIGGTSLYLHPLDGPAWRDAILRLAHDDAHHATLRAAIAPPPTWADHFRTVADTLHAVAR